MPLRRNGNSFWKDAFTKKTTGPSGKYFNKIKSPFLLQAAEQQNTKLPEQQSSMTNLKSKTKLKEEFLRGMSSHRQAVSLFLVLSDTPGAICRRPSHRSSPPRVSSHIYLCKGLKYRVQSPLHPPPRMEMWAAVRARAGFLKPLGLRSILHLKQRDGMGCKVISFCYLPNN